MRGLRPAQATRGDRGSPKSHKVFDILPLYLATRPGKRELRADWIPRNGLTGFARNFAGDALEDFEMARTNSTKRTRTRNAKATKAEPTRLEAALAASIEAAKAGDVDAIVSSGVELASARAEAEALIVDAFTGKVQTLLAKAKLEAPAGVSALRIDFGEEGLTVSPISKGRSRGSNAAAPRTGSGFRVSGPGVSDEFGSYSTAAKAVKQAQGLHPSVNGKTFWKDQNGVSVKSHQEQDPSWAARTGSVWMAGDFKLTITR